MQAHPLLLVALGGAIGSFLRHGVTSTAPNASVAVFFVNVVGSLALGSIVAWLRHATSSLHGESGEAREHWAALLGLGFCGGLTTFSTHMVDVAQRLDSSSWDTALLSLAGTTAAAVAAACLGYAAVRRLKPASTAGVG